MEEVATLSYGSLHYFYECIRGNYLKCSTSMEDAESLHVQVSSMTTVGEAFFSQLPRKFPWNAMGALRKDCDAAA